MLSEIETRVLQRFLPLEGEVLAVGAGLVEWARDVNRIRTGIHVNILDSTPGPNVNVDAYCAAAGMRRIALLKVAGKGREQEILRGAVGLLRRRRIDLLQFEYGQQYREAGTTLEEVVTFLRDHGFGIFRLGRSDVEYVSPSSAIHEDFQTSHFVAVASRFLGQQKQENAKLDLLRLIGLLRIRPRGVIHIGAHIGEELELYRRIGFEKILLIEANPDLANQLRQTVGSDSTVTIANVAISDTDGMATLHVTSEPQSSSILRLKKHKLLYPDITETRQIAVPSRRLDTLLAELTFDPADFNYIHLDIQGAELMAMQGAGQTLGHIQAITTEVNFVELYEGCGLADDLDDLLESHGFEQRAMSCPFHCSWGDAFYVRQNRTAAKGFLAMSTLGANGRFANQIFQYALLRILAQKHDLVVQTPAWIGQKLFGHDDPLCTEALPMICEGRDLSEATYPEVLFRDAPVDRDLWGHFQFDTSFYKPYATFLRSLFEPVGTVRARVEAATARLRERGKTIVGLHLRRGDYGTQEPGMFWVAPSQWYLDWLKLTWEKLEKPVLFIASDDPRQMLADFMVYAPVTYPDLGEAVPDADFYPDFYLLSQCDLLAISNSSFSFAASMLNSRATGFWRPNRQQQKLIPFDPWNAPTLLDRGQGATLEYFFDQAKRKETI